MSVRFLGNRGGPRTVSMASDNWESVGLPFRKGFQLGKLKYMALAVLSILVLPREYASGRANDPRAII